MYVVTKIMHLSILQVFLCMLGFFCIISRIIFVPKSIILKMAHLVKEQWITQAARQKLFEDPK